MARVKLKIAPNLVLGDSERNRRLREVGCFHTHASGYGCQTKGSSRHPNLKGLVTSSCPQGLPPDRAVAT